VQCIHAVFFHRGAPALGDPALRTDRGLQEVRVPGGGGQSALGRACDDRRLVGLKLIVLIVTRVLSLLGLSRREAWWKNAEILILRDQLAVAQREQPRAHARLTWPDRAWLALLAGTLHIERLAAMRLFVTPATILRSAEYSPGSGDSHDSACAQIIRSCAQGD
jgi:hypothetical protein